jgi:cysteine desulfurase
VASLVGFGKACELSGQQMVAEGSRLVRLRDRLHLGIADLVPGVESNGHPQECLPGTVKLSFEGIEAEALILALEDLAVSPASACTSASSTPSCVLKALGLSDSRARASLRFSLGRFNTEEEVDWVITQVAQAAHRLRDRRQYDGIQESALAFQRAGAAV